MKLLVFASLLACLEAYYCAPLSQAFISENETASRILQALNKDVDPCTDFYEFACGGWIKQNPVPDWANSWNQISKLSEQLDKELRKLLEAKDDEGLPNSVVKAKSLYRTCINTVTIRYNNIIIIAKWLALYLTKPEISVEHILENLEAVGIKPIQKLMRQIGLPPNPPSEVSADFTWEEVAGRARRQFGLNLLLNVNVGEDIRKINSRNLVMVDQVSPGFITQYLLQPEKFSHELQRYHSYIRNMIIITHNETDAEQFADEIVDFSKKLAKIMTPADVRRSCTYLFHDVSMQQLLQGFNESPAQWKQHDWDRYLKLVFSNTSVTLQLHQDRVIVFDLPYLQKLSVLLADTKPLIIERFLWWSVYRSLGSELYGDAFLLQQPSRKSCLANVQANFGMALSYLYVKRHFDNTSRQKAIEMVEDVRSAFAAAVQELDWMNSTTRLKTLDKLHAIRNIVGFPDWLLTHEQLDKHYKHAEVVEGNLFETYLKLKFAAVKKSLESLREKPDRDPWFDTATTVNAFFSYTLNSAFFPAGILQPPFSGNGIEAINYGSIGAILGHEITHGFDDQGICIDEEGNLKQWWPAETVEHYHKKVQCIIDQYSKYHIPQLSNYTVNGFNTQGENIADNGGFRAALHAYQLFAKRAPADRRVSLPGLPDYTPDQLFFLGFAQTWCSNTTVDGLKFQMVADEHSPEKVRVIGTLSNSAEFAAAWSCPAGTPMNPVHKCVLW